MCRWSVWARSLCDPPQCVVEKMIMGPTELLQSINAQGHWQGSNGHCAGGCGESACGQSEQVRANGDGGGHAVWSGMHAHQ